MNSKVYDALRTVLDYLERHEEDEEVIEATKTLETYLNTFSN